jgi:hypothetical protein
MMFIAMCTVMSIMMSIVMFMVVLMRFVVPMSTLALPRVGRNNEGA